MPGFFRFERKFSLPRSSWPIQQLFTSCSARQAFHFDSFPWWDIFIVRWNWLIPNLGRLWHIQPIVHPSDSVWEEKDDGLHGQIWHQPQEHSQLTAQELYKGEIWRTKKSHSIVFPIQIVRSTSFPWQRTSQHTSVGFILLLATTKRYWYHCAWMALCFFYCGVSSTIKTPGRPPVVVDHCYNCYNFM